MQRDVATTGTIQTRICGELRYIASINPNICLVFPLSFALSLSFAFTFGRGRLITLAFTLSLLAFTLGRWRRRLLALAFTLP